jgi:hypothetical protein
LTKNEVNAYTQSLKFKVRERFMNPVSSQEEMEGLIDIVCDHGGVELHCALLACPEQ